MADRDLCFMPASDLVRLYRARKVWQLEVMQVVRRVAAAFEAAAPRGDKIPLTVAGRA